MKYFSLHRLLVSRSAALAERSARLPWREFNQSVERDDVLAPADSCRLPNSGLRRGGILFFASRWIGRSAVWGGCLSFALAPMAAAERRAPDSLTVATVQMRSTRDLHQNAGRISRLIRDGAAQGARVVVFPECALTGYFDSVTNLTASALTQAELEVTAACREAGVYAVVGSVHREGDKIFNSALVVGSTGKVIERYHKIQLAERWPDPGDHLSVFKIDDTLCSVIICHDERYPELVRLPVLAGARVVFYISHESGVRQERKLEPYRAQIQARAVENTVFVVHANAPANEDASGSHGQSRIIAPDGNILQEASIFGEDVLRATLDLSQANRGNALKSISRGPLGDWWKEGVRRVRVIEQ